jgi:uncharacterized protein (DUF1697 family)
MTRYVAFLRAINVGGHIVKMDHLRTLCEAIPLANVATFIASGNVLFDSKKAPAQLEAAIEKKLKGTLGYGVAAMVRSAADLSSIVEHVREGSLDHDATLYVGFMKSAPPPQIVKAVTALSNDVDLLSIRDAELYWQCRTSFSESTVAGPKLERLLGRPVTLRNYNTVRRLAGKLI